MDHWWSAEPGEIRASAPSVANAVLPVTLGLAVTLMSVLVLQVLLIAVAFGTANYVNGQPHSFGAALTFWSAVVVAISCGLGALVSWSRLRRADVEADGARLIGGMTPAPVVIGLAINGLAAGTGARGLLVVLVSGTLGASAGVLIGTGREGRR